MISKVDSTKSGVTENQAAASLITSHENTEYTHGKGRSSLCPAGNQQHFIAQDFLHNNGIAGVSHNDLKPENIFLAQKDDLTPDNLSCSDKIVGSRIILAFCNTPAMPLLC